MTNMPNPYHQDEAQETVRQCAKIKLERELGLETLSTRTEPKVIEIILNAGNKPWQKRAGEKMHPIGALSASHSNSTNKAIAGYYGQEITKGRPLLEREPSWMAYARFIHYLMHCAYPQKRWSCVYSYKRSGSMCNKLAWLYRSNRED